MWEFRARVRWRVLEVVGDNALMVGRLSQSEVGWVVLRSLSLSLGAHTSAIRFNSTSQARLFALVCSLLLNVPKAFAVPAGPPGRQR